MRSTMTNRSPSTKVYTTVRYKRGWAGKSRHGPCSLAHQRGTLHTRNVFLFAFEISADPHLILSLVISGTAKHRPLHHAYKEVAWESSRRGKRQGGRGASA
jgi:hypothetical protein